MLLSVRHDFDSADFDSDHHFDFDSGDSDSDSGNSDFDSEPPARIMIPVCF